MRAIVVCLISAGLTVCASAKTDDAVSLFDAELSNFELWMGIPHDSVKGLPEGTPTSKNCHKGTPLGLDNDVKNVFTMIEKDGESVLHISGEVYGGLTTLKEYENYHLSIKMKWGDKKWEPRLTQLRDSGILYHCHGKHGTFWNVWKSSLECQVQETDMGDFIEIAGPSAEVRTSKQEGTDRPRFDSTSETYTSTYTSAWPETDAPHGEWNTIEIYTLGDTSVHLANGKIVMVVENAKKKDGTPLTRGQIQIQSEAAECFYKEYKISSITDFPPAIKAQLRLKD